MIRRQLATHCDSAAAKLSSFPGDPSRLIGDRDNRSIEASSGREPLQPLGTAIVMLRDRKADPRRELPTRAKMAAVVNRGDEHCCDQHTFQSSVRL